MSIREVASMLGCSVWSVRQRFLRKGLPHFRSGPSGKLMFFRQQVVVWILAQQAQMKGGVRS
jgi:phage terminase Nu1 subunit (DNA packaging protein)